MNLVSKYVHDEGFYINSIENPTKKRRAQELIPAGFQGDHCFEPVVGIQSGFVLGVDYQSLYPSVIRRYNIDPSTLVLSETTVSTHQVRLTDNKGDFATFVSDAPIAPIAKLLEELGKSRVSVKKLMKTCTGIEYSIMNQKQLAIKVMMNSTCGFLGTGTGPIGHPELAAAVTVDSWNRRVYSYNSSRIGNCGRRH